MLAKKKFGRLGDGRDICLLHPLTNIGWGGDTVFVALETALTGLLETVGIC